MISLNYKADKGDTESYLKRLLERMSIKDMLTKYGDAGVSALSAATPKDSGLTASLWGYEIDHDGSGWTIHWTNDNINNGVNVAIILQYGHGTGTGGYVNGIDFINPALAPIFEQIANDAWKEVTQ